MLMILPAFILDTDELFRSLSVLLMAECCKDTRKVSVLLFRLFLYDFHNRNYFLTFVFTYVSVRANLYGFFICWNIDNLTVIVRGFTFFTQK